MTTNESDGDNGAVALQPAIHARRVIILASDIICFGNVTLNLTGMIRAHYTPPPKIGNGFDYDSAALDIEYGFAVPVAIGADYGKPAPFKITITGQAASAIQSYLTERSKTTSGHRDILFAWLNWLKGIVKRS